MEIYTAFLIGLVGSLHCIGMCGPIVVILPVNSEQEIRFAAGRVLYNIGRILTYGFMGLVIGFIGNKLMLYGFQQTLSILLGVLILLVIFLPKKIKAGIGAMASYYKLFSAVKNKMGTLFKSRSLSALFVIGLLNGFLPCGLVYVALGIAAASGSALSGLGAMLLFGLGTLPVMLAVSLFYKIIPIDLRNKAAKFIPAFAVLLAVIFILRGLNLGIPFISPKMNTMTIPQIECTH